ncbi:hypothetical protein BC332_21145 [Capsicum chinense]|nr:hypothetical protein BC332_21145 [Capsicum chinense]
MIGFLPYSLVSVVILIKRRQFEQVKAAVPVILGVLKSVSLEAYEEGTDTEDLFLNAFALADSIQAVCKKTRKIRKNSLLYWACLSCKSWSVFLRLNSKSCLSSAGSFLSPL